MNIQDKAAIVTGAGTGVGQATAIQLARQGCQVLVAYRRSREGAEQTVAEIEQSGGRAVPFAADVVSDDDASAMVQAALEAFGRLDILVNNAGTTEFIPFAELERVTDHDWHRIMSVNVLGPFHCARAAARAMRETSAPEGAEIVNVTSVAGINAAGSSIPYAASKAALSNMTVALARTLAPAIRVNGVAPGFIAGRWLEEGLGPQYEATKMRVEEKTPLGKVCRAADVAKAITSLITGSDLVTGQILVCDGGMLIASPVAI